MTRDRYAGRAGVVCIGMRGVRPSLISGVVGGAGEAVAAPNRSTIPATLLNVASMILHLEREMKAQSLVIMSTLMVARTLAELLASRLPTASARTRLKA